ncbi:Lin0512 family protein [Nereida sp. MMG025]|uniref:Lin0512 family protein n=1 Tax=Nereida sp. MMG025 TaxID=2909981 RepID=UPI001F3C1E68|nr:Lin0512 family protein [Nereida sp. MMG025]MCF6444895.1 Lin0512 family protein [Nereida sp. MMG025]
MTTRLLTEFGMGTSLRRGDYTAAARKALQDALWHNSINLVDLFDAPKDAMQIDVEIACQNPSAIDPDELTDIFPYGQIRVTTHHGGLDVPRPRDDSPDTIIAHATIHVSLDLKAQP